MSNLWETVTNLPAIAQSAIGSGLFALIVYLGQKIIRYATERYSKHSKDARHTWLLNEMIRHQAAVAKNDQEFVYLIVALMYRASRPAVKALMWLALGIGTSRWIPMAEFIGFLGAMFYLLKTYEAVRPVPNDVDYTKRLLELKAEFDEHCKK